MEPFAPDFSQFWHAGLPAGPDAKRMDLANDDASKQQAALAELAERVNAARSVV